MNNAPVTYSKTGRMNFHPEYHENHFKAWKTSEQKYLIENYDHLGPEQIGFALSRTINSVMEKARQLRKLGLMIKPAKPIKHKRIMNKKEAK